MHSEYKNVYGQERTQLHINKFEKIIEYKKTQNVIRYIGFIKMNRNVCNRSQRLKRTIY